MGPLLFNIDINDLKSATSKFDLVMYAVDTTLGSTLERFGDRNNANEIVQNRNNSIFKITTWLQSNKLRLNVSKFTFVTFFKHSKVIPKLNIPVNNNQSIKSTSSTFWELHLIKALYGSLISEIYLLRFQGLLKF